MNTASQHDPQRCLLEKIFVVITGLSFVLAVQMLVNIPEHDIQDVKDLALFFPNMNDLE